MNPVASLSDFRTRLPGLPTGSEADAQIEAALDDAATEIDFARVTNSPTRAHVMLAAHFLALSAPTATGAALGGETGPITAQKMGEISASFANVARNRGGVYSSTVYGRVFESLLHTHEGFTG
jgi:hypothetical protein